MMWGPVGWMTGTGLAGLAAAAAGGDAHPEALYGLAGPLASANLSWLAMAKAEARGAERLMRVMIGAMAVKMVFFGVYVAVVLLRVDVRPVPFVASFAVSFIGLYAMEAWFLKRLIDRNARQVALP